MSDVINLLDFTVGYFTCAVTVPFGSGRHVITATADGSTYQVTVIVLPVGLWPPGQPVNNVDSTSDSPGACVFQDKLYLFWKANDASNAIVYSASADGATWPAGQRINGTDTTSAALAACVFQDKLYLFWKANDASNRIYFSFSADGLTWRGGQRINNVDSTSDAPAACLTYLPPTEQAEVFLAWKDASNVIYRSSSADGITWPAGLPINNSDATSAAPAVHFAGALTTSGPELFWKSAYLSDAIYFTESADGGVTWRAGQEINNSDSTSAGPACCVFRFGDYVFWKVNDPSNRIYYSAAPILQ